MSAVRVSRKPRGRLSRDQTRSFWVLRVLEVEMKDRRGDLMLLLGLSEG